MIEDCYLLNLLQEVYGTVKYAYQQLPRIETADFLIELYLRESASIDDPLPVKERVFGDKSDLPIPGAAVSPDSTCLITGDKALLSLKKYGNTDILSPGSFWEEVKRKTNN